MRALTEYYDTIRLFARVEAEAINHEWHLRRRVCAGALLDAVRCLWDATQTSV